MAPTRTTTRTGRRAHPYSPLLRSPLWRSGPELPDAPAPIGTFFPGSPIFEPVRTLSPPVLSTGLQLFLDTPEGSTFPSPTLPAVDTLLDSDRVFMGLGPDEDAPCSRVTKLCMDAHDSLNTDWHAVSATVKDGVIRRLVKELVDASLGERQAL